MSSTSSNKLTGIGSSKGRIYQKPAHPHAGRINASEKAWFWIMVIAGLLVYISGLIMDFPNFGQVRRIMQVANIIHASLATLFIAASIGYIYIGTIGTEGTFDGMWTGHVSTEWAKQHTDLWYEEKAKKAARGEE